MGKPTSSGMTARKMPTAPRNPTQEMNSFSRQEKRNGARQQNTAAGRAKTISVSATASAGSACSASRSGHASRPSSTNITICASQVSGIEKHHHGVVGARRPVADHQAGQVDGQETRGMHDRGEAEDHQRAGGHERRMQALRQSEPVEREHDQAPAQDADEATQNRLPGEHAQHVLPGAFARQQEFDQQQREKHRERIVAAGFDLQNGADPRAASAIRGHG